MNADPDEPLRSHTRHLAPALVSLALSAVGLLAAPRVAARWARAHLDAVAPENLPQKNLGILLQREAARAPGILLLYGSSELVRPSEFRANEFFARRPGGFAVSPVGSLGTPLLVAAQEIGALGAALAGRKVVLLLSPSEFLRTEATEDMDRRQYAGNYSRLQGETLIFSSRLPRSFKRRMARRMLRFSEPLRDDPVLGVALQSLAAGGGGRTAGYYLALPFGRIEMLVGQARDALAVLELLVRTPVLRRPFPATPRALDWARLTDSAQRLYRPRASHNPFGFEDAQWLRFHGRYEAQRGRATDSSVRAQLSQSRFWPDLALVLEVLQRLGARPLVLSPALPGRYYAYLGTSPDPWGVYYQRLRALTRTSGAQLVTLEAHNADGFLSRDGNHPSPEGWVLLDRALDDFSHDALP